MSRRRFCRRRRNLILHQWICGYEREEKALNLEGDLKLELDMKGDALEIQGQSDMEHNSEECAIVGGDGKKIPRRDCGNCSKGNVPGSLVRKLWLSPTSDILEKLNRPQQGLVRWATSVKYNRVTWVVSYKVNSCISNDDVNIVLDLIDVLSREWKTELINNTLSREDAARNLRIPLAKEAMTMCWYGKESPQECSLCEVPVNYSKKVMCPRCEGAVKNTNHILCECPITRAVWERLKLAWILTTPNMNSWEWLTWVFKKSTSMQCRLFCCFLWAIWTDRNKGFHEGKRSTGTDIAEWVTRYVKELDSIEDKGLTKVCVNVDWCPPNGLDIKSISTRPLMVLQGRLHPYSQQRPMHVSKQ
ncbi:hypothetical protein Gogos_011904 [Gossypium gossypioides]|uniref:Reverse transcriptase zinc-binding domain-containing protein n=1 Tax=Gossypium gossypioides TaxID=34282 RepID=A0A7J9BQY3_GOSGO|nr:hypothetical protein [Gossypium gossypioides]